MLDLSDLSESELLDLLREIAEEIEIRLMQKADL